MNGNAKEVKHKWILLAAVTTAGFLADVGTKYLAVTRLQEGRAVNVIGEYLQWLLVYNTGAVFGTKPPGFFSWMHPSVFLSIFMLFAISFLLFYYRALNKNEVLMRVGLILVLPGAFGNLYDRLIHGKRGVVDFIRMGIPPDNYWFIYNVADIFVTVGVAVMIINFALEAVRRKPRADAGAAGAAGESVRKEADSEVGASMENETDSGAER
ncbi:MAG: signal peptidase II [Chitinispirillales bacterium]|nr:signal peptidase II [Chitinispirillales bacterium]